MPTRNTIKSYCPESYYHIYSRGLNGQILFNDDQDYLEFLYLLKRYLSDELVRRPNGQLSNNFYNEIELLAFCLMPNHFHLFVYQRDNERAITDLMRGVLTGYSMYYNKKYQRRGPVFESRYLASMIDSDAYLLHITRYIHLNPRRWQDWPYSSLDYYLGYKQASWVRPRRILGLFGTPEVYMDFLLDYDDQQVEDFEFVDQ